MNLISNCSVNRFFFVITFFLYQPAIQAFPIDVPMRLNEGFLQNLLLNQIYTENQNTARVWDDGKDCNLLVLSSPVAGLVDRQLHTRTMAEAHIGTIVGNRCLELIQWKGIIEIFQEPVLGASSDTVEFVVVDSKITEQQGNSPGIIGTIWNWIKRYVHPRFNRAQIRFQPVLDDLKDTIPLVFPDNPESVEQIINSVVLADVSIHQDYIELGIHMQIPPAPVSVIPESPQPALNQEELAAWEKHWQSWDAFLTNVIKKVAADTDNRELHTQLLGVLLDARQDLTLILSSTLPSTTDPVAGLFVSTWEQLAPVLQKITENQESSNISSYLKFITAANALVAIKKVEEDTGFHLTIDALRRLARIMIVTGTQDPLYYDIAVDKELRTLFGFGPPLSLPLYQLNTIDQPHPEHGQESINQIKPLQFHAGIPANLLIIFTPAMPLMNNKYVQLTKQLNGWVPTITTLDKYLPLVQELLDQVADITIQHKKLENEYYKLYQSLVLATAWQESCWRQFIKVKGQVTPIQSQAGSVGIMQINQYVWRGFYDLDGLFHDIGYNALAGSEILHHYLVDYAIASGEHHQYGGNDNLARATYAMYNGGPRQINRYKLEKTSRTLKAIDNAFWKKFELMRTGNTRAVSRCYTG